MNVRDAVTGTVHLFAGLELTPEEYLWATDYLRSRVRWPAGQHWELVDDTPSRPEPRQI